MKKLTVLYSRLSGYVTACLKGLVEDYQVTLQVVAHPVSSETPFEEASLLGPGVVRSRGSIASDDELLALVQAFGPDAVFVSGWSDRGYLRTARRLRARGIPVVAGTDTQWKGTLRQYVGVRVAPWVLHRSVDVLWVAGERQRRFARRLGYAAGRCWSGVYACDWEQFAGAAPDPRRYQVPAFLYVGRYVREKGLDVLLEAYARYRQQVESAWPLICAGAGPMKGMVEQAEGVVDFGFVQPHALPALMQRSTAFVLPSHDEPWGVVVQEAAASGLPLLCTDACGATVHLLQDGYNGLLLETGDVESLLEALCRMTEATAAERAAMGKRGFELSKQFTPARWAETFVKGIAALA